MNKPITEAGSGVGKKILCITGNPCVDRLVWHHGDRSKPSRVFTQVGGKGANVSRMMSYLGCDTTHLMVWQSSLDYMVDRETNRTETIPVTHPIRVLPNYIDMEKRTTFLDYKNTNQITPQEAAAFLKRYTQLLGEKPDMVIISGSACNGLESTYPTLVHEAKALGLPVILDSHGDGFTLSLREKPDFVKPNREELEMVVGKIPEGGEVAAARKLIAQGVGTVLLTMGDKGSLYITADTAQVYPILSVPTINAVGCGDSFVSYFAYGLLAGLPMQRCMELGAAAGAVNAGTSAIGRVKPGQVNKLLKRAGLAPMPEFK